MAQDTVSRERIAALGGAVGGELDLKLADAPLPCDEAELERLTAAVAQRPIVLGASTHPGEDEFIAEAVALLDMPQVLLVLAPRHPARAPAIAAALRAKGWRLAQRSQAEPLTDDIQIYLADTLGELGLWFRLARAVVMGGGFAGNVGGHNPLEPARLAAPILAGPDTTNHREAYAGLVAEGAARLAATPAALAAELRPLLADPALAQATGSRAKAYAARSHAALAHALDALRPLLPEPRP